MDEVTKNLLTHAAALALGAGMLWLRFRKQKASDFEVMINAAFEQISSLRKENHELRQEMHTQSSRIEILRLEKINHQERIDDCERDRKDLHRQLADLQARLSA